MQVSFGPVAWLIVGEVFPAEVRSAAVGCATLTNFGSNFAVSLVLPVLQVRATCVCHTHPCPCPPRHRKPITLLLAVEAQVSSTGAKHALTEHPPHSMYVRGRYHCADDFAQGNLSAPPPLARFV